jgi:hypothetical protein
MEHEHNYSSKHKPHHFLILLLVCIAVSNAWTGISVDEYMHRMKEHQYIENTQIKNNGYLQNRQIISTIKLPNYTVNIQADITDLSNIVYTEHLYIDLVRSSEELPDIIKAIFGSDIADEYKTAKIISNNYGITLESTNNIFEFHINQHYPNAVFSIAYNFKQDPRNLLQKTGETIITGTKIIVTIPLVIGISVILMGTGILLLPFTFL